MMNIRTSKVRDLKVTTAVLLGLLALGAGSALAQGYPAQGYPTQSYPAPSYPAQGAGPDTGYPPGGYLPDDPRVAPPRQANAQPDFDALDDDDAHPQRGPSYDRTPQPYPQASVPQPYGAPPVYGAPPANYDRAPRADDRGPAYDRPVYSDRAPQGPIQGPVMSPDDPRYGRAQSYDRGPPPVIYSNRPQDDGLRGPRPPEAIGGPTGSVSGPDDRAENRPMQIAALPPEEQPEVGNAQLPPHLRRQEVAFATKEPAGTIVVDTPNTYLYYVLGNGRAMRYGIRVGRDGFRWNGVQKVTRKMEWPDWHPPAEMIERQPYLPRFMAGGEGNPLGARAMYLGSTVYRIHGTNQPSTIGKTVSSGCFGMLNDDVSDLFERVKVGTRVVVLPGNPPASASVAAAASPAGGAGYAAPVQTAPAQQQAYPAAQAPIPGTQPSAVAPLPAPVMVR